MFIRLTLDQTNRTIGDSKAFVKSLFVGRRACVSFDGRPGACAPLREVQPLHVPHHLKPHSTTSIQIRRQAEKYSTSISKSPDLDIVKHSEDVVMAQV